ncbi:MAG: HD domain-containing protein [Patescibacteria group bacterium]
MRNPFRPDLQDPATCRDLILAQDKRLLEAARTVAGAVPRAMLVGGFVRDALLGRMSHDADLEVYGIAAEELERTLEKLFPGRVHAVGRAFGVFKVRLHDDVDLDVAIPRRESKSGAGHRGFVVTGDPDMSLEDASRRRDFTVNAMTADSVTGEVSDPHGGRKDLSDMTLRATDTAAFPDDPLRVYRAAQFVARFGFAVEPVTMALMTEMVRRGDLDDLSAERVTDEVRKILLAPTPSAGFGLLRDLGVIGRDYPELQALIGVEQEQEWHPEGDVWTHTLIVLDMAAALSVGLDAESRLVAMLGALCHDLGKPATSAVVDGRIRAIGHEEAGTKQTKALLDRWTFSASVVRGALAIVGNHMMPIRLWKEHQAGKMDDRGYRNGVRRILKRIAPLPWEAYLTAVEADRRGRTSEKAARPVLPALEEFREMAMDLETMDGALAPLLTGENLIGLGIAPGPEMGEWLRRVEEVRDAGELETKEEAIAYVRRRLVTPAP